MKRHKVSRKLIFSPSDLTNYLSSPFVTWMDRFRLEFPGEVEPDPDSETNQILQEKGIAHELSFLEHLKNEGRQVVDVSKSPDRLAATLDTLKNGSEVVYQGELALDEFSGFADFLVRVPGKSNLGDFLYEPWDTKLARSTKPYYLTQLCCYAEMLESIQGVMPSLIHVVLGNNDIKSLRTEDFLYYYRAVKSGLLEQQLAWDKTCPPSFSGNEDFGRWTSAAERMIQDTDHLCQVADIRATQMKKLSASGIKTMTALAGESPGSVAGMKPKTLDNLRHQARLQKESIGQKIPKYELLSNSDPKKGLRSLPPPSEMDVYFDMEGFPLVEGGLEYLFGASTRLNSQPEFHDWWALDANQEKAAFEQFIDWVVDGGLNPRKTGEHEAARNNGYPGDIDFQTA